MTPNQSVPQSRLPLSSRTVLGGAFASALVGGAGASEVTPLDGATTVLLHIEHHWRGSSEFQS